MVGAGMASRAGGAGAYGWVVVGGSTAVTSLPQYYLCFGLLGAAGIAGILIPATTTELLL